MNDRHDPSALRGAADRLVTAQRDRALHAWLANDGDPAAARVKQVWDDAADLGAHPGYADLLGPPTMRERLVAAMHALREGIGPVLTPAHMALATACLVVVALGIAMLRPAAAEYSTQIAEVRELTLPDGSQVTLGAKSEIQRLAFSADARRVRMGQGEAFFSVAKNADRPFIVMAGDALIRVVGTKFNVKYNGAQVKISVLEGVVQVIRPNGDPEAVISATGQPHITLTAGQQTVVAEAQPGFLANPVPIQGDAPGAWREGRLSYEDAPLGEVIADANRYRSGAITITSPALARERINTSLKTSQIDQMLDTLPGSIGAQVVRKPDGTVEIRGK
jgi:transmembrane sensor